MVYDQVPENPITAEEAVAAIETFIAERSSAGVRIADAFTSLQLTEGVLSATWSEDVLGKELSDTLLGLNPFENLAAFIGTPLSFENEEGRQIREHVRVVAVVGPFGVGSMTARELYQQGTGLS